MTGVETATSDTTLDTLVDEQTDTITWYCQEMIDNGQDGAWIQADSYINTEDAR